MKAFVSLHTAKPDFQTDSEASYAGYERVEIDFSPDFAKQPTEIMFPVIEDMKSKDVAVYAAIGSAQSGQGEIFMRVPALPNIVLKDQPEKRQPKIWIDAGVPEANVQHYIDNHGYIAPRIIFHDERPGLPDSLNPIARIAHGLIFSGLVSAADLHPKLYEAINDALHNAGVPIIPVVRQAAAKMDVKMSQLPSFQEMASEGVH